MRRLFTLAMFASMPFLGHTQFHLLNDAVQLDENTWRLTQASPSQKGQIWHQEPIDLNQDWQIEFRINMGTSVTGGDGLTFTLQTSCLSAGGHASAMGVVGIEPSVFLEFDSYFNSSKNDPDASHIALFKNGDNSHGSVNQLSNDIGSNNVSVNNMENGQWRDVIVSWEASTQTLALNYSGFDLLAHSSDLINEVFGGSSAVYWGFTASTGAAVNVQRIQMISYPDNNLSLADLSVCAGDSVQTGFVLDGSYTWQGQGVSNPSTERPWFSAIEDTQYVLSFEDACGQLNEYSFNLFVEALPESTIAVSGDGSICEGSSTVIQATLSGDENIEWYTDGELIEGADGQELEVSNEATYFAIVSNEQGCQTVTNSLEIDVVQAPIADLMIESEQLCPGQETTLFTDLEENESIQWYLNGELLVDVSDPIYSTVVPGEYSIQVSISENCSTFSEPIFFSNFDSPETSSISGNTSVPCDAATETYSVEETNGSMYAWTVPEGAEISSGQGSSAISIDFNGNFGFIAVVETNQFGCEGEAVSIEVDCTSNGLEYADHAQIRIYPNPVQNSFRLNQYLQGERLSITDLNGKIVWSEIIHGDRVELSALSKGVYLACLEINGQLTCFKIVKV